MTRKILITTLSAATLISSSAWAQPGQGPGMESRHPMKMHKKHTQKGKRGMRSIFLIQHGLPHYSKILMKMWDDPKLALSSEQKSKLEAVRNRTIQQVKEIAPQVKKLTLEIVKESRSGVKAESLSSKVDTLASLKAKATKVQLQCIEGTRSILTSKQLEYVHEHLKQLRKKHRKHS
ncbi:hypothetical protein [Nitratifractor sp.]|uniref:hypothetical protein n=1 Tax=Nitratifractor sp. TaxID=2268144 RepID=UPI0025D809BC|nr:hypothetical protein [Nitratifractor sp.]